MRRSYAVAVLFGVVMVAVSTTLTLGAAWLGWWAGGQDALALIPAAGLGGFVALVMFGLYVPFAFTLADAGSIRQAKKALHDAEREGRRIAAARARARLRVARWQKRR